ncbi:hypothetical protein JL722_5367 [Aureococcus anophagefferens]|nr:hypothetical protein JL722_5367 [Aureococcus anophagefferens]
MRGGSFLVGVAAKNRRRRTRRRRVYAVHRAVGRFAASPLLREDPVGPSGALHNGGLAACAPPSPDGDAAAAAAFLRAVCESLDVAACRRWALRLAGPGCWGCGRGSLGLAAAALRRRAAPAAARGGAVPAALGALCGRAAAAAARRRAARGGARRSSSSAPRSARSRRGASRARSSTRRRPRRSRARRRRRRPGRARGASPRSSAARRRRDGRVAPASARAARAAALQRFAFSRGPGARALGAGLPRWPGGGGAAAAAAGAAGSGRGLRRPRRLRPRHPRRGRRGRRGGAARGGARGARGRRRGAARAAPASTDEADLWAGDPDAGALPAAGLQYLSFADYCARHLALHRREAAAACRRDVEAAVARLAPGSGGGGGGLVARGRSGFAACCAVALAAPAPAPLGAAGAARAAPPLRRGRRAGAARATPSCSSPATPAAAAAAAAAASAPSASADAAAAPRGRAPGARRGRDAGRRPRRRPPPPARARDRDPGAGAEADSGDAPLPPWLAPFLGYGDAAAAAPPAAAAAPPPAPPAAGGAAGPGRRASAASARGGAAPPPTAREAAAVRAGAAEGSRSSSAPGSGKTDVAAAIVAAVHARPDACSSSRTATRRPAPRAGRAARAPTRAPAIDRRARARPALGPPAAGGAQRRRGQGPRARRRGPAPPLPPRRRRGGPRRRRRRRLLRPRAASSGVARRGALDAVALAAAWAGGAGGAAARAADAGASCEAAAAFRRAVVAPAAAAAAAAARRAALAAACPCGAFLEALGGEAPLSAAVARGDAAPRAPRRRGVRRRRRRVRRARELPLPRAPPVAAPARGPRPRVARARRRAHVHARGRRWRGSSRWADYEAVVFEEAAQITDAESLVPLALQRGNALRRVVLVGDDGQLPPVVSERALVAAGLGASLFSRLRRLGARCVVLDAQGRCRPEIADVFRWRYGGAGPRRPPGVAPGGRALLADALAARCGGDARLGMPGAVETVDKYQGREADYVLLSLTRTRTPGHLADPRRFVVATSRARLGLYVFGHLPTFRGCAAVAPAPGPRRAAPRPLAAAPASPGGARLGAAAWNWVGVQMLFYPLAWRGVPAPARLARLAPRAFGRVAAADGSLPPFGPLLGWQGVVPAKAPRMARDLVAVVAGDGGLAPVRAELDESTRRPRARVAPLLRAGARELLPPRLRGARASPRRRGGAELAAAPAAVPDAAYAYADAAFDLEATLGDSLAAMEPRAFERLLHPI